MHLVRCAGRGAEVLIICGITYALFLIRLTLDFKAVEDSHHTKIIGGVNATIYNVLHARRGYNLRMCGWNYFLCACVGIRGCLFAGLLASRSQFLSTQINTQVQFVIYFLN